MKQVFSFVFAGIIGGMIVLFGNQILENEKILILGFAIGNDIPYLERFCHRRPCCCDVIFGTVQDIKIQIQYILYFTSKPFSEVTVAHASGLVRRTYSTTLLSL